MLREALQRILAGTNLPAELIAIDQSPTPDDDLASLSGPDGCHIRYVPSDRVGLSRGQNLGVSLASHELIVFTHDDLLPEPDWCGAMVAALREVGPGNAVTGRVSAGPPEAAGGYAPSLSRLRDAFVARDPGDPDVLHPMNLGLHRDDFVAVGGWDARLGPGTRFPGGEDHDLEYRLRRAGVPIHYRPDIAVVHRAWRDERTYLRLRLGYGRGHGAFLAKHFDLSDGYAVRRYGRELRDRVAHAAKALIRDPRGVAAHLAFVIGMLVGAGQWLARYRRLRPNAPSVPSG